MPKIDPVALELAIADAQYNVLSGDSNAPVRVGDTDNFVMMLPPGQMQSMTQEQFEHMIVQHMQKVLKP